jgi:hypothetical protein
LSNTPGIILLAGCSGLALYTAMRLGWLAPRSTAALAELMGLPSAVEKLCLLAATTALFAAAVWRLAQ